jgi:hypothetical protein
MFCPKCGQQQPSEQVRFCSRCGICLDVVKTSLAGGEAIAAAALPRKRDINIGVALMFIGTLLTYGITILGDRHIKLPGALFILVVMLISVIFFSQTIMKAIYGLLSLDGPLTGHVPPRRKDMSFGAILMFIATIMSGFVASFVPGPREEGAFFFAVMGFFALLLFFSHRIMRAAQEILGDEKAQTTASLSPALLPAENIPVTVNGPERLTTGALAPPSVTERTTNLIENG